MTQVWPRTHSDAKESALQAASIALSPPLLSGHNFGFVRPTAKLYLVLVTDEIDQSDATPADYVNALVALKGNLDFVTISAITGPPEFGCPTASANPVDFEAVNLTGGQFRSICSPDWWQIVNDLAGDVTGIQSRFALSGYPADAALIDVTVCDATATCRSIAAGPSDGWSYDAAANMIVCSGTAIPAPGENIHIEYDELCVQ